VQNGPNKTGRVADKVAIITGAGNGMGACEAKLFAKEGAKVVVTDIDAMAAEEVAADIVATGGSAIALPHDVSSEVDWARVIENTIAAFGRIDILVNNAGIHIERHMADIDPSEWNRVLAVNLTGAFLGTQAVVPLMKGKGSGAIVNIASVAALIGSGFAHYSAAKGGLRALTRTTAVTYAKDNIRANSVYPGVIKTNITSEALANPQIRAWLEAGIPMPRFGESEDVAYGVLYLASDEASFITGSELVIDGGTTAV